MREKKMKNGRVVDADDSDEYEELLLRAKNAEYRPLSEIDADTEGDDDAA